MFRTQCMDVCNIWGQAVTRLGSLPRFPFPKNRGNRLLRAAYILRELRMGGDRFDKANERLDKIAAKVKDED
ncbi:hypothetical protein H6G96_32720 [Nostoc sp. FACHB-892]|uniref:hypothetical protein n=1 Tax=Nostoc sp. FACHB-892 TaxID=2692843 RepID=UPI0016842D9D|nr:hypothetical protein [Nostoc sp. FACHB-892]MBD2730953.1 hypothetical protein [Nostoc sp. FACHB-892]